MRKTGKYVYWRGRNGKWYFHYKSANGRITDPSQGYASKAGVKKAIERDKRDRKNAPVESLN